MPFMIVSFKNNFHWELIFDNQTAILGSYILWPLSTSENDQETFYDLATHVLDVYCVCVHTAQCTCSTGHKQCTCHKTKHLTMKNQTRHQRFVKFCVDFKRCLYFVFWNWASLKTSQKQTIILDISRRSPHIIILANLLNLQIFPLIYFL